MNEPQEMDADRRLDEVESLYRLARERGVPDPFELYHRASVLLRCRREVDRETSELRAGREEGLALRLGSAREGSVFGAASGGGDQALEWVVGRMRLDGTPRRGDVAWDVRPGLLVDRDADLRLPQAEDVERWLDEALERLARPVTGAWVEVALTVETWVATGGGRASRARARAWAVAEGPAGPPWIVAARRWEALAVAGWRRLEADRAWPRDRTGSPLPRAVPVLFSPEASSALVSALVRGLHAAGGRLDQPVGPAWDVTDDPLEEGALSGGLFDDSRYVTTRRRLADGERIVGLAAGPGHFRRPSFRDPPQSVPSNLSVAARPQPLPPRCVLVSRVVVHPLDSGDWILQCAGGTLERGEPGPPVRGHVHLSPADLVRRCVGTFGDPALFHRGVRTPALLFDDLPWTPDIR